MKHHHNNSFNQATTVFDKLPFEVFTNIVKFCSLEDYAYGLLQICKSFNKSLGPRKSPHIIRDLMKNECYSKYFGQSFSGRLLKSTTVKTPEFHSLNPMYEWQIIASFAKYNKKREQIQTFEEIEDYIASKDYDVRIESATFLLDFMYKCKYGNGINASSALKLLFLQ